MAVHGCTGLYMAVQGCTWLYRAVQGCTGLYMAVQGCTWLYMAVHGCTWLYMAVHGYKFWSRNSIKYTITRIVYSSNPDLLQLLNQFIQMIMMFFIVIIDLRIRLKLVTHGFSCIVHTRAET